MSIIELNIPSIHCSNIAVGEQRPNGRYRVRYNIPDCSDAYDRFRLMVNEKYGCAACVMLNGGISEKSDTRFVDPDALVVNLLGETCRMETCVVEGSKFEAHVDLVFRYIKVDVNDIDGVRTCTVDIRGLGITCETPHRMVAA